MDRMDSFACYILPFSLHYRLIPCSFLVSFQLMSFMITRLLVTQMSPELLATVLSTGNECY